MLNGPGSRSIESLHGWALLDRESIDGETKYVGCLQSLSLCSVLFNLLFCLGFLVCYGSLLWPLHLKTLSTSFDSIEMFTTR